MIAFAYLFIPLASIVDSNIFYDGRYPTSYLIEINLWESSLFMFGMLVGTWFMRMDRKLELKLHSEKK